jgi:hypothetical protein
MISLLAAVVVGKGDLTTSLGAFAAAVTMASRFAGAPSKKPGSGKS